MKNAGASPKRFAADAMVRMYRRRRMPLTTTPRASPPTSKSITSAKTSMNLLRALAQPTPYLFENVACYFAFYLCPIRNRCREREREKKKRIDAGFFVFFFFFLSFFKFLGL